MSEKLTRKTRVQRFGTEVKGQVQGQRQGTDRLKLEEFRLKLISWRHVAENMVGYYAKFV